MRCGVVVIILLSVSSSKAQVDSIRNFIFGHSLISHEYTNNPPPSDELTVPHWLYLISQHSNKFYGASGQYGFLPQHENLPPIAQWGFDLVPAMWDSDNEPFSAADFNNILFTAGNFIQWQGPTEEYPSDPGVTPISASVNILNWVEMQEDNLRVYIYENWPDMGSLFEDFPPNSSQMELYNNNTLTEFHDWWIEFHDSLRSQSPYDDIKMIPVGPIIAELYMNTSVGDVPILELYEDNAPHGRPSIYFLAGLITYMAFYEEKAPLDYPVPSIVHSDIANNYENIVEYIWTELLNFNFDSGESRVFYDSDIINSHVYLWEESIELFPNPTTDYIHIKGNTENYNIDVIDSSATLYNSYNTTDPLVIDISDLPNGLYFIRISHKTNGSVSLQKIIKSN